MALSQDPSSKSFHLSEDFGSELTEPIFRLLELITHGAKNHPDALAIASFYQPPELYPQIPSLASSEEKKSYSRWTYKTVDEISTHLAKHLEGLGLRYGMPLATLVPSGVEWSLAMTVSSKLCCPFVPINPRNLANADEVGHMLRVTGSRAVVTADNQIAKALDKIIEDHKLGIIVKIQAGCSSAPGWSKLSDLVDDEEGQAASSRTTNISSAQIGHSDVCLMAFTSGTTALPKACGHTPLSISTMAHAIVERQALDSTSKICITAPTNHMIGILSAIPYLRVGGSIVFASASGFSANATVSATKTEQCTNWTCVPKCCMPCWTS